MMRSSHPQRKENLPVLESTEIMVTLILMAVCWLAWYVARERFYPAERQIVELACFLAVMGPAVIGSTILIIITVRRGGKDSGFILR
jgi:ABC-type molybdate transport system permease subunit